MSKAGRNEVRRTAANFLNGVATALVATGYLAPMVAGQSLGWMAVAVILASAALHALATRVVKTLED
jgi:hypothetical protein